jgi:hypothetical protein
MTPRERLERRITVLMDATIIIGLLSLGLIILHIC